jgi:hypothetical protein
MDPARCRSDIRCNVFEKRDDVVIGALFDFENVRYRKARLLANFNGVILRDLTEPGHRLAGENFDLEPDLELALIGPNVRHLRP